MADETLEFSIAELEEGVALDAGKEYEITELEATGKLVFLLRGDSGVDPVEDQDFTLRGLDGSDLEVSGKTDAEGKFEHSEPVPFGDYNLEVGEASRRIQAIQEGSGVPVVTIPADEIEGPHDAPGSDEDEDEEEDEIVPLVEIFREGGTRAAPSVIDVEAPTVLEAVTTPRELEGTWEWSCESDKLTLTPDGNKCTIEGSEETAEGEEITVKAKITPSEENVGEGEDEHVLTVQKRVVELFFQRSPGFPPGNDRGIEGISFRVQAEGETIQEGTTEADGKAEIKVRGEGVTVELMVGDAAVASYEITLRDDALEGADTLMGRQRRLRMMGYHLGSAGPNQDGVDGSYGRRTDRAILEFQVDSELDADGEAGPLTQAELTDVAGG